MDLQINEIVKVNLVDGRAGTAAASVNTAALLVKGDPSGFPKGGKFYAKAKDFTDEFQDADAIYTRAVDTFFAQESTPAGLWVIAYDSDPVQAVKDAAEEGTDFYNVIYLDNEGALTASKVNEWNTAMAGIYKVLHVQTNQTKEQVETLAEGLKDYDGLKRVALYLGYYKAEEKDGEGNVTAAEDYSLSAPAIVANRCGVDPARGTWAHKTLVGVKAMDVLTISDIKNLAIVNEYRNVAGEGRLFFDYTASGGFIDETVKQDWVKFNIETEIYNALRTSNSGYGVEFNDSGIAQLQAIVGNVLNIAADSEHRYIGDDFTVTAPRYRDLPGADKKARNVSGIKATCSILGAVHTVLNITVTFVD